MKIWRLGIIALVVLVVIAAAAFALIWRSELPATAENAQPETDSEVISRGYALAELSNCASCHTAPGGQPYAGGLAMPTPFGTIRTTNITPDRDSGIGSWSEKAFARAMRQGIDREGGYLYPAFPYNHFTHASDEDIHALYAYFRSIPAVNNEVAANDLSFPFNIRFLIAGWNLLFLDTGQLKPVSDQDDEWNRGRYLAEGLAHCGACHTPRNLMGAEKSGEQYHGALIDGWYAPPLAGDTARGWSTDQMNAYLATGFSRDHGAAAGPMAETTNNLSRAAPADVQAIAVYIASLSKDASQSVTAIDNRDADLSANAQHLWQGACAQCHESADDAVGPSKALPLSISASVRQAKPTNVVRTIFHGIHAYRDSGGPYMPAFGDVLSNDEIAALVNYVRRRYSDGEQWRTVQDEISSTRASMDEQG